MTQTIRTATSVAQKFNLLDEKAQEFILGYLVGYQARNEKKEDTQK